MVRRNGVFIFLTVLLTLVFAPNLQAQDSSICPQNEVYQERWQTEIEAAGGLMWDDVRYGTFFAVSPDGSVLAVADGKSLTLYDPQTLVVQKQLEASSPLDGRIQHVNGGGYTDVGQYNSIAWSPDGNQLAATYYVFDSPDRPFPLNGIQIWDVAQGQLTDFLQTRVSTMTWSPDSSAIASATPDGDIWLWDITRDTSFRLYHRDPFSGDLTDLLSWSPDGHYLAASHTAGGSLRLYTLGENEPQLLESPSKVVVFVSWSPKSDEVVTGDEFGERLPVFNVNSRDMIKTLTGSTGNVYDIQWSPDGKWLARGTQNGLYLWDMTGDNTIPVRAFDENMPPFVRIAWLPDSQHLISVDFERAIYRWNVETGCVEAAVLNE